MFNNYFKIAWRNLKSHRLFTVLNIAGLAIGLAVSVLLYLFIVNELSFDKMYKNEKNIYRALTVSEGYGMMANVPNAVGPAMAADIPEVKMTARMIKHGFGTNAFIKAGNNEFIEKNYYSSDSSLFQIFDVAFVAGNPLTALSRPNTVVLSEKTAKIYFGNENPIGKKIEVDNYINLEVTGVFTDFPDNSTLDCNIIASFNSSGFSVASWGNASFETYFLLNDQADIKSVENKMQQVLEKNVEKEDRWFSLSLQPLREVHLYSAGYTDSYTSRNGDIKEVRNLSFLVVIILLIACINYMNLSTAQSQKRAKEVAINKTLGATIRNLILRFYTETAMLTFLALLTGILLAVLTLPVFNNITGKNLELSSLCHINFLAGLLIMWVGMTLISGSYPALYLSGFSPILALKQSASKGNTSGFIRKGLVVVQFASSVILIFGVIVIYQQMEFIRNKNLGFQPENVVMLDATAASDTSQIKTLLNDLKSQSSVLSVTRAQSFPGMSSSGRSIYKSPEDKKGMNLTTNDSQKGIVDVLKLKLLAGTDLPAKVPGDTIVHLILNKKAVDYLGFTPEQAIGMKVNAQLGNNSYITGVVDNFNFASLHEPMGAYAFNDAGMEPKDFFLVRFKSSDIPKTMSGFEKAFRKAIPDTAFDFTFLDQYMNTLYASEQRMALVILIFSILAIIVACLGLFGLTAFTAEQRTKEIGVRKVLGASVSGITVLLSKDFLKLVFISIIIAAPVAWWVMTKWLQDFAYKINISWWVIGVAGLTAIIIALITVSFQAIKAAIANPVESLRTE